MQILSIVCVIEPELKYLVKGLPIFGKGNVKVFFVLFEEPPLN